MPTLELTFKVGGSLAAAAAMSLEPWPGVRGRSPWKKKFRIYLSQAAGNHYRISEITYYDRQRCLYYSVETRGNTEMGDY